MEESKNPVNTPENKDIQLTIQDFKNEGIEVKLNQNDILEIIADAKYQEIREDIDGISSKNYIMLHEKIYKDEMAQVEEYKSEILQTISDYHPDVPVEHICISANISKKSSSSSSVTEYLRYGRKSEKNGEIRVDGYNSLKLDTYENDQFIISCTAVVTEDEILEGGEVKKKFSYKFSKPLTVTDEGVKRQKVKDLHKLYDIFKKKYSNYANADEYSFNLNKITRDARVELNKRILSVQAPDIKKALKKNFKIDLNAK